MNARQHTTNSYHRAQDLQSVLQQQLRELEVLVLQHLHEPRGVKHREAPYEPYDTSSFGGGGGADDLEHLFIVLFSHVFAQELGTCMFGSACSHTAAGL